MNFGRDNGIKKKSIGKIRDDGDDDEMDQSDFLWIHVRIHALRTHDDECHDGDDDVDVHVQIKVLEYSGALDVVRPPQKP